MQLDLIIYDTELLTMEDGGVGYLADAALGIKGDKIAVVGNTEKILAGHQADRLLEGKNLLVMPGLIDAHIHTGIALLRGLAQDISGWMEEGLWPFSRQLDREAREAGTALNIMEAVRNGTTLLADFGSNLEGMVKWHRRIGTRALLSKTINELDSSSEIIPGELYPFDHRKGEEDLAEALTWIEKEELPERISFFLGPQAPDMLSLELLKKIYDLAGKLETGIHMHVAQGEREHRQMRMRYNSRTIPWLAREGLLNSKLNAVHLTEATPEETRLLARSGAGLTVCSGSIGIIDGQVPPLQEFLEVADRAALGSDQAPGNNCNNMFNEMKLTALFNKIRNESPLPLPAWKVLRLATIEAAGCLGLGDKVGSLTPGKFADLITIDLKEINLSPVIRHPLRNLVPNLVYSARGSEVRDVMVAGRFIFRKGRMVTVEEEEILKQADSAAARIMERVDEERLARLSPLYQAQREGKL